MNASTDWKQSNCITDTLKILLKATLKRNSTQDQTCIEILNDCICFHCFHFHYSFSCDFRFIFSFRFPDSSGSAEKVFLKISNFICAQSLFFKIVTDLASNFIKKEVFSGASVFLWILQKIFNNTFFYRTLLVAVSENNEDRFCLNSFLFCSVSLETFLIVIIEFCSPFYCFEKYWTVSRS